MRALFEAQQKAFEEQRAAFLAETERRAAEATTALAANSELTARIDQLLQLGQQEQNRRLELEKELKEERERGWQAKPLVDVSKLGQKAPERFTDSEAAWPVWSWLYRNYLAAANPAAREAMNFAEACKEVPVEQSEVVAKGWKAMSEQLYSSLAGFTAGESSSIVRNTVDGQGLEAWRKLSRRWNVSQATSRVAEKEKLLACTPVPDERLGKALQDWEV